MSCGPPLRRLPDAGSAYEEQLRFKERKVYNNLKRIGGLSGLLLPEEKGQENLEGTEKKREETVRMEPIIGMEEPWRYRNKAQFPFGRDKDGRIIAGFYAGRTHCIVEMRTVCWVWRKTGKFLILSGIS